MDTLMKILTHVITALLAAIVTLFCVVAFDKNNTPARTESTTNATGENVDPDYCKLEELQDLIETYYIEIDSVDMEDLKDAAAAAMVDATGDLWSYYISADELQAYYESVNNAYVGVGITIIQQEETGYLEVMEVAAGGPAETAGVLTGDLITGADNKSFQGMHSIIRRKFIPAIVSFMVIFCKPFCVFTPCTYRMLSVYTPYDIWVCPESFR